MKNNETILESAVNLVKIHSNELLKCCLFNHFCLVIIDMILRPLRSTQGNFFLKSFTCITENEEPV